jgi:hypothetical protein
MVQAPWRHGDTPVEITSAIPNGWQVLPLTGAIPCSAAGQMLETPSIRRYSPISVTPARQAVAMAVTLRPVRTISRKDQVSSSG